MDILFAVVRRGVLKDPRALLPQIPDPKSSEGN